MWERDHAAQAAGVEIVEAARGRAVARLTVRGDMVNGHGIAHGGFVFALADSAFAFACNSYDVRTVAYACSVTYLAPTRLGDALRATATERSRVGRTGTYDVTVTTGDTVVAEFRGTSRTLGGSLLDE